MVTYQDSEIPITCPFCDSENVCNHLLALFNVTDNLVEGGYLMEKLVLENELKKYFLLQIEKMGSPDPSISFKNDEIKSIWEELLYQEGCHYNEETNEWELDLPNINLFVFECLENLIIPEIGEFEGGPGGSSYYKIFYTDDISKTNEELLNEIQKAISNSQKI
jgi:hypothetical protein